MAGCRICVEVGHSKPECQVIDLYQEEDPRDFEEAVGRRMAEPDISDPLVPVDNGSSALNTKFALGVSGRKIEHYNKSSQNDEAE